MWAALVLVWISSLALSGSLGASDESRYLVPNTGWSKVVKKSVSAGSTARVDTMTSEKAAVVPPSPVTLTEGTRAARQNSTGVSAEMTTNRTNTSTLTSAEGTTDNVTSPAPTTPMSTTAPGPPSLSAPHAQVPSMSGSMPPTATVVLPTQTIAATTTNTSGPSSTLSPAETTYMNSTASPVSPGTTVQVTTDQPALNTARKSTLHPSHTTLETTTAPSVSLLSTEMTTAATPSVTSVSSTEVTAATPSVTSVSTVVITTQAQGAKPTARTVPAPPVSPSPKVETTAPTAQPGPASPTWGTGGPSMPQTPEQVETKTTSGTATTGLTPRSSGDPKVPTTDSCQLSTQGQYLVVTTEPLTPSLVNRTFLVALLVLGVTLFITVLVVLGLQAYENYKKKDYTQVDYLINGMYADSEM